MIHGKANELPFKVNYQEDGMPKVEAFQTNSEAHAFRALLVPAAKSGDLPSRISAEREPEPVEASAEAEQH